MLLAMPASPAPLVLVTGNEELLVERAVRRLLEEAGADASGDAAAVAEIDVGDLATGGIRGSAAPSLFGGQSVVVVRGIERMKKKDDDGGDSFGPARAELLDYVSSPDPDAVVVLVHAGGVMGRDVVSAAKKAGAQVVDVSTPAKGSERDSHRRAFVVSEFRGLKIQVAPQAADLLVVAVGSDLRSLAGACAQLAADVKGEGGSRVDVDVVGRYYGGRAEVDSFAISNLLMSGRTANALVLLRQMLAHEPLAKVGPMLVGAIAYRVRQEVSSSRGGWQPAALARAVKAVAAADSAVKGGEADGEYALERMIISVSQARGAAR
jgi:DNA polymerase-3 subunit delta